MLWATYILCWGPRGLTGLIYDHDLAVLLWAVPTSGVVEFRSDILDLYNEALHFIVVGSSQLTTELHEPPHLQYVRWITS